MALLEIIRHNPPELGRCRAAACRRPIEWVKTPKGANLPVDVPLHVAMETPLLDGGTVLFIDNATVHWASCPERAQFSRKQRGGYA